MSIAEHEVVSMKELFALVNDSVKKAKTQLQKISDKGQDNVSIGDVFEMQFLMNQLSELCDMASNTVAASHAAIVGMARNVK